LRKRTLIDVPDLAGVIVSHKRWSPVEPRNRAAPDRIAGFDGW
jgi:hypothetical protein